MIILANGQLMFNPWYAGEGRHFLEVTIGGLLMFLWEARYDDGRIVRQFDEINWSRAMTDDDFVPNEDLRLSVDALEKERVSQFILHPVAMTKKNCPWFQQPIETRLDLKSGDRLVNFWLTDYVPKTGYRLRRHVVGIERDGVRILTVVCPSGKIIVCSNEDQSFEGE